MKYWLGDYCLSSFKSKTEDAHFLMLSRSVNGERRPIIGIGISFEMFTYDKTGEAIFFKINRGKYLIITLPYIVIALS